MLMEIYPSFLHMDQLKKKFIYCNYWIFMKFQYLVKKWLLKWKSDSHKQLKWKKCLIYTIKMKKSIIYTIKMKKMTHIYY